MIPFNHQVAENLRKIANLLDAQNASPFRSRAYLNAANTVENLTVDVGQITQNSGIKGLIELPAIGAGIAQSIYEYVATGRMTRLDNLQGSADPVKLFQSIPTVGKQLAQYIHDILSVNTFEELGNALSEGQLDSVPGIGTKRKAAIEVWLSKHLGQHRLQYGKKQPLRHEPTVALLLKVDSEYSQKAARGDLPLITPKRFNPDQKKWLPILHVSHADWNFTALYSNTSRAHQLNRIRDWVIIYFFDGDHQEGQQTVVTETRGALIDKRVVRGREAECIEFYSRSKSVV
ncbi:MAG: NAD-dependent DNA ligase [Gammaproteobacteria bacterium]|jgi:NAD-dependent DNA ligase